MPELPDYSSSSTSSSSSSSDEDEKPKHRSSLTTTEKHSHQPPAKKQRNTLKEEKANKSVNDKKTSDRSVSQSDADKKKKAQNQSKSNVDYEDEDQSDIEWCINANDISFEKIPMLNRNPRNYNRKNDLFEIKEYNIQGEKYVMIARNAQTLSKSAHNYKLTYAPYFNEDIIKAAKYVQRHGEEWLKQITECKGNLEKVSTRLNHLKNNRNNRSLQLHTQFNQPHTSK